MNVHQKYKKENNAQIIMEQQPQLNDHNKQEYPPMHTAEHLLNATMVKTFGCPRSRNAHIEKKKSKCDYELPTCPTEEQIHAIEEKVNEAIDRHLPVTCEFMTHEEAQSIVDLSKLPGKCKRNITYCQNRRLRCLRLHRATRRKHIRNRSF